MRLTRTAFASAIRKGLGRALLYATQYGIDAVNDIVLDACLHNLSYDRQCEPSRAWWLFCFFKDTRYYDAFRASLIKALDTETETYDLDQMCDLLKEMAADGDKVAKQALYHYVKKQAAMPGSDEIGIDTWIELEGAKGLIALARLFGRRLQKDPKDSPYQYYFGTDKSERSLKQSLFNAAQQYPYVGVYWSYLKRSGAFKPPLTPARWKIIRKNRRRITRKHHTFSGIVNDAQNGVGEYPGHYVSFGQYATARELEKIHTLLIAEPDNDIRMRLLWVFRRARLPHVDKKILLWANGTHEGLRAAAISALAQVSDRRIRRLAIAKVKAGEILGADNEAIDLFLNCYRRGDAELIANALCSARPEAGEAHCLGFSITGLAERYHDDALKNALRWTYENNPCTNCRYLIITELDRIGRLDARMINECRYDASEETRTYAGKKSIPDCGEERGSGT